MGFDAHGGVSVFELAIYIPEIIVAAVVCSRHGFNRSSGWIYTLILCLVRILGAVCQLATYQSPTQGLFEAVLILDSIGISPLLLATLGLLSRCVDTASKTTSGVFTATHFRLLQLLITIGLILGIVGGTSSTVSADGAYQPAVTTMACLVIYLVAFVALCVIAAMTKSRLTNGPTDDKRLVWAVIIALPIIFIRLIYSLISVFAGNGDFNLVTGSVVIHVFMAILEEMVVVCIYLVVGWKTVVLPREQQGPIASRPWKGDLTGGAGARRGPQGGAQTGPQGGAYSSPQGGAYSSPQGGAYSGPQDGAYGDPYGGAHGGPRSDRRSDPRSDRRSRSRSGSRGGGGRRKHQGPIHALVEAGVTAARQHQGRQV